MSLLPQEIVEEYTRRGWWGDTTLSDCVRRNARERADSDAFVTEWDRTTWRELDALADRIAARLVRAGFSPGDRVGVVIEDGPLVHATYVGAERAGLVVVGLGHRAGDRELAHLISRTRAVALVSRGVLRDDDMRKRIERLGLDLDFVAVDEDFPEATAEELEAIAGRAIGPNDLFLLNSTSGTTGMPKLVTQFQNRWFFYRQLAQRAAQLRDGDVFMSLVPTPFGFGLWTSHFVPTIMGLPTVEMSRFDPGGALRLIERERVTVLAAVSTQFVMLLNSPEIEQVDLSSLRAMFTGGEAVPYEKALDFERRTGCAVLQFFGSNETGGFSGTSLDDPVEKRLTTAGRILPEMDVRLFDDAGTDVTASGGPAQPGGRGPATCAGYYDDPEANAELYTADGYMLMGDEVTIDDEGYLTVVGRKSDFVIRGGKNISAPAVEAEVGTHPSVDLVAAIAVPDPVFGERVCVVVTLAPGASLDLAGLTEHLSARGVSRETFPEHLLVVDEMPVASGGKIAKGALRERAPEILEQAESVPAARHEA